MIYEHERCFESLQICTCDMCTLFQYYQSNAGTGTEKSIIISYYNKFIVIDVSLLLPGPGCSKRINTNPGLTAFSLISDYSPNQLMGGKNNLHVIILL